MIYAIVANNIVTNVVVDNNSTNDQYINITDLEVRPNIGWQYDGSDFIDPNELIIGEVNIPTQQEPFILSPESGSMIVKIDSGHLFIGCYNFDILWAKDALVELLTNNAPSVGPVNAVKDGVKQGNFFVTWADLQRIQDFLIECGV